MFGCDPTVVSKKGGGGYRQTDRQTDRHMETAALYNSRLLDLLVAIELCLCGYLLFEMLQNVCTLNEYVIIVCICYY